jgi:WD40 repeat protein
LASYDLSDGIVLRDLSTQQVKGLIAKDYDGKFTSTMSFYENDTRFAALGDDGTLVTWNIASGKPTIGNERDEKFPPKIINPVFSPGGNYLIYNADDSLKIWDVANNTQYTATTDSMKIKQSNYAQTITFSPDGKVMAFSNGKNIIFYDFPELTKQGGKISTNVPIRNLSFVTDNSGIKYLITFDDSGNTQFWDWNTRTKIGEPISGISIILGTSTQDHSLIYIDNSGKLVKFNWDLNHESWKRLLCPIAARNFSKDEWNLYFSGEDYPTGDLLTCPDFPPGE